MRHVTCRGLDKPWSAITFGCWQIAPSGGWGDYATPQEADAVVKAALEGGITAFDTAEGYGDGESERRLGKALGQRKDDVIIISKIWPDAELTLSGYQSRLEGTLRALNRDYVDLYLIHWPSGFNTPDKSKQLCDIMTALQESGKVHTIGMSNFGAPDIDLLSTGASRFIVNQIPYSLLEREFEDRTLEVCKQHGIGYMAYSPTARGLLAGRTDADALKVPSRQSSEFYNEPQLSNSQTVRDVLQEIADETKALPIQVAIAWVLEQDNLVTAVVGSKKHEQVREFAPAGDLKLSPDQLSRLTQASDHFHSLKS